MVKMEKAYGTVFVAASGNANTDTLAPNEDPGLFEEQDTMPYEAFPYMSGMMVVGASTREGTRRPASNVGTYVEVYAPGDDLPYPVGVEKYKNRKNGGTSPGKHLILSTILTNGSANAKC